MNKSIIIGVAIASISATTAIAADTYRFDKTHTNIIWSASHLGFSKSFGTFSELTGNFTLDEDAPKNSSVEVTVKTGSIVTGISGFDRKLKSKDFLNSIQFPEATFKSTKVMVTGEKTAKIHGELTMLGQTHPLVLSATLNKIDTNHFNGKHTAGFSLTGLIDRSLYGITYGAPGIPDTVNLMIEAEGVRRNGIKKQSR